MRGLRALCVALAGLALTAGPAAARSYDVPGALAKPLQRVKERTAVAVLLPSRLALDFDGRVHASGGATRRGWALALAGAPRCGGATACFLASFTARRGARPSYTRTVRLTRGITGYFKPLSCGASCSPPAIEWMREGVLYAIQAKVPGSARRTLVAAANSAIAAGPR